MDEKGLKMSKSLGNVVDPDIVIAGGKGSKVCISLMKMLIEVSFWVCIVYYVLAAGWAWLWS